MVQILKKSIPFLFLAASLAGAQQVLQPANGGTGQNSSGWTGCPTITSGVWNSAACPAGISGLTTGYIPVATSSTTLTNSHIDDGVTTAAVITITEPLVVSANELDVGTTITSGFNLATMKTTTVVGSAAAIASSYVQADGTPADSLASWQAFDLVGDIPLTFGGSGQLQVNPINSTEFSSLCQGCIGVNTATPNYALDVYGNGAASGIIDAGGSGGGYKINGAAPAAHYLRGNGTLYVDSTLLSTDITTALSIPASATVIGTNSSSQFISASTTGSGNVMLSASPTTTGTLTGVAANFSGSIGIGTSSPSGQLTIGTPSAQLALDLIPSAGYGAGIYFGTGASGALTASVVSPGNSGELHFSVSGSQVMIINYAGYVGIGTTTPHSPLAVVGLPVYANNTAAIAGGLAAGDFYRTGADPDPVCVVHSS